MSRLSTIAPRAAPYLSYAAVAAAGYVLAIYPPSVVLLRLRRLLSRLGSYESARNQQHKELSGLIGTDYVPPLPEPVVQVLARCCLCFLATTADDSPHLSLMRFSFSPALDDSGSEVARPRPCAGTLTLPPSATPARDGALPPLPHDPNRTCLAAPGQVLIVSTNRNTKKYKLLCANKRVALLIHDFAGENESDLLNYTALEGRCGRALLYL